MTSEENRRCGFTALIGPPNSGKSTLVNAIVGTKVSIVTPKIQTTRNRVLGIVPAENSQIVLIDTPGIFAPKKRLERSMVAAAWNGARDADIIALIFDVSKKKNMEKIKAILEELNKAYKPCILVLNKIDLINKEDLLDISAELNSKCTFDATFMISALKKQGLERLTSYIAEAMPKSPWMFDEDMITDMPSRLMAAEITREKIFLQLHQEIPYGITVQTEHWEESEDGQIRIHQIIFVSRDNYKGIILGKGGSRIKKIGESARLELCEIMDATVHLKLHVKVKENWSDDADLYAMLGLDFNA